MIGTIFSWPDHDAGNLVLASLGRSVTSSMVCSIALHEIINTDILLAINPNPDQGKVILEWLNNNGKRKLILFGKLPEILRNYLHITETTWPLPTDDWARSQAAESGRYAESKAFANYLPLARQLGSSDWQRPLERFDFTNEWNNLGFGAIRADQSIWSLSTPLRVQESAELATIQIDDQVITSYAALFNETTSSTLWINRAVGLIDTFEWHLVENFISQWRHEDQLPCLPVISEIPFGYDAAITMRLDCDEDISSAKLLWNAYQDMNVPLSLAIHTNNLPNSNHESFLQEFIASGGSILSHTATHAPNWGGSYDSAYWEATESRTKIKLATGIDVKYAVSPFHQAPDYALSALCDAGYQGCIGGIIKNDPEFLLARGGQLVNLPAGFIGHSQQTMLHGDCMLTNGDPLMIFKKSFDYAKNSHTFFGYLDHPFSARYQYGWQDEKTRILAHQYLIQYIRETTEKPIFMNECQALDFIRNKTVISFQDKSGLLIATIPQQSQNFTYSVEFRGKTLPLTNGMALS